MIFYEGHKVYMNGEYPAIFLNGHNQHIHRLQWVKHHGEIPKGYVVHHKDENKLNWDITNLELITRSEHLKRHKGIVKRPGVKVIAIKDDIVLNFDSIEEAAEHCGTYPSSIQRIFNREQKKANGWWFIRGDSYSVL
jgi:hypothetical protein